MLGNNEILEFLLHGPMRLEIQSHASWKQFFSSTLQYLLVCFYYYYYYHSIK